jgi:hypothetical protein
MNKQEYQELTLKERAEYCGEVLDNVRMGLYDEDKADSMIEAVQLFLLNEVTDLRNLIASDSYAASFQSMSAYRKALLKHDSTR